jgi:hypothetical protein
MLQEIKDRPNVKDFPKMKMLYTENKKLPRSVFHNRFTWPRAYNPLLPLKYLLSSDTLVPRKLVLAAIWRD